MGADRPQIHAPQIDRADSIRIQRIRPGANHIGRHRRDAISGNRSRDAAKRSAKELLLRTQRVANIDTVDEFISQAI